MKKEQQIKDLLELNYNIYIHDFKKHLRKVFKHLDFICENCGECCKLKQTPDDKRIVGLFKAEVDLLRKNKKLYGVISREHLDKDFKRVLWIDGALKSKEDGMCIFYDEKKKRCKIHSYKPLRCFVYPFLFFTKEKGISAFCKWIQEHKDMLDSEPYVEFLNTVINALEYYEYLMTGGIVGE